MCRAQRAQAVGRHCVCHIVKLRVLGLKGVPVPHSCLDVALGTKLCFDVHVGKGQTPL
jgi:hypothetical protein